MIALMGPALGAGWALVKTFLSANGLLAALVVGGLVVFVSYDTSRVNRGRELERAKVSQANDTAATLSNRVRAKSRAGGVRGARRDPYSLD